MKKKIFSTIVSVALASSCVAAMNSGALAGIYNGSLADSDFAGYIKEDDEKYWSSRSYEGFAACYVDISQAPKVEQVLVDNGYSEITYKITGEYLFDENIDDILKSAVKEIDSSFDITVSRSRSGTPVELKYIGGGVYPKRVDGKDSYFTAEEVRKIKEALSPYVDEMEYIPETRLISRRYGRLTTFCFGDSNKDYYIEGLNKVVEESGVDAELKIYDSELVDQYDDLVLYNPPGTTDYFLEDPFGFSVDSGVNAHIVTGEGVTNEEIYELSKKITDEIGLSPYYLILDSAGFNSSGSIDLYNAIDGDANNDGEVDIADATLILQYIGNPDKYQLSLQGEYNADVDCSGGVTALDALEVQRIDAKLG
ncbi:MAG: dockerin type I repeat-containing protein [Alistipes sp.]|nr:dockerin type I repeat-containing protein [Alistipes sp.]